MCSSVLQCVAACFGVLQRVAAACGVSEHCLAVRGALALEHRYVRVLQGVSGGVAGCCSVLQYVAGCCNEV